MIKGLFFDFDGTLCDLVELHFVALNEAIERVAGQEFVISKEEHNKIYNGLSTKTKLKMLTKNKKLPVEYMADINKLKQEITLSKIPAIIKENYQLQDDLSKFKTEGYKLYCVSNALMKTVELGLKCLGIYDIFDGIMSNDNVRRQKPSPDIYLLSFVDAGLDPKECLIIEDSKHGRESGYKSGAHVCTVDNPSQTTYETIKKIIDKNKDYKTPWCATNLNVLIPMAGAGSRFKEAGFKLPKPLIDVNGKPMIQRVVENLNMNANFIFLVQKSHYEEFNLGVLLPLMVPNCKIVQVDGITKGAACTTLLAKEFIDNDDHLLIANSDQYVLWDSSEFMSYMLCQNADGGILTFKDKDKNPKWSFAKADEYGDVSEVAEKNPISDTATIGIYYYKSGKEYIKYAEQMISKDIKTNNEYYVCPIYNEYIQDNKKVKLFNAEKMFGLGTPEDLNFYLSNKNEY